MVPSGNPLQSTRAATHRERIQPCRRAVRRWGGEPTAPAGPPRSCRSSAAGHPACGYARARQGGKSREDGSRPGSPYLPMRYMVVAPRNYFSTECGFGLAVPAASCNHLQPLECMGEIGEIYLFIVVICRQWVFLMRNICFCVFPENIIPL